MKKRKKFYRKKRQQGAIYRSLLCFMLSVGFLLEFISPISVQAAEMEGNLAVEESTETEIVLESEQTSETENTMQSENIAQMEITEIEILSEAEATTEESTPKYFPSLFSGRKSSE